MIFFWLSSLQTSNSLRLIWRTESRESRTHETPWSASSSKWSTASKAPLISWPVTSQLQYGQRSSTRSRWWWESMYPAIPHRSELATFDCVCSFLILNSKNTDSSHSVLWAGTDKFKKILRLTDITCSDWSTSTDWHTKQTFLISDMHISLCQQSWPLIHCLLSRCLMVWRVETSKA